MSSPTKTEKKKKTKGFLCSRELRRKLGAAQESSSVNGTMAKLSADVDSATPGDSFA